MAMVAQLWTLSGLAVELGKDRRAVGKLLDDVPADGQAGTKNSDAWRMKTVVAAMMRDAGSDDLDLNEEKARQAKESADKLEMENAARRGELIERSDVDAAMFGAFARVRAKLLSIPSKSAPLIVQDMDIAEVEHLLRSQVSEALQELADTNVGELEIDHSAMVEGTDAAA